jgi:putative FmdB family regulatory protein
MPTYEYACSSCGNAWEEIQKITAPAIEVCPACHKPTAKRQISGGNFILKGGGWYSDLYSSTPKKGGDSKSGDGPGAASGETKTETKTESAPKTSESKKDGGASAPAASASSASSGSTKAAE